MSDARFPAAWLHDRRVMRLSNAAFRLFVIGMTWSVSNRTDGVITDDDLPLLPFQVGPKLVDELTAAGVWERDDDRHLWLMVDYRSTQTTAAQFAALDHKRFMDRERQARHRKSKAGSSVTRDTTRDNARDGTRDAEARQGQARQGLDGSAHDREFVDGGGGFSERLAPDFHPNGHRARPTASELWERGYDD